MIERQRHSSLFGKWHGDAPPLGSSEIAPDRTVPGISLTRVVAADEPMILGFPAVEDPEEPEVRDSWAEQHPAVVEAEPVAEKEPVPEAAPVAEVRLVTLPRADPTAGTALVLAGVAAVGSLWLPWRQDREDTGWSLVRRGLTVVGSGVGDLGRSGLWQPFAVVLGGVLLFLLGVLLFLPERTHRTVGVLALLVVCGPIAGVLVRIADAGWNSAQFGPGMWLALAVPALGLLGAFKAMLTSPHVALRRRRARTDVD